MRIIGAWAILLVGVAAAQAQVGESEPTCRALRQGEALITKVEFADGYTVEAPWIVVGQTRVRGTSVLTAVLHLIIEREPSSGRRQTTALPNAVEMTFRGSNTGELLDSAASIWCATVKRARPPQPWSPGRHDALTFNRAMM